MEMESGKDVIKAIIGVFSGRPNPELLVTGKAAEEFVGLAKKTIGVEPIHPPPPPKLWHYYGFIIRISGEMAKNLQLPAEFSVFQGVITEGKPKEKMYWRDVANVERFLIDQAYEQGYGNLLEEFGVSKSR